MMKELQLTAENTDTSISFHLPEKSLVELFLHRIGRKRSMRITKVLMYKGIRSIKIKSDKLQEGIYVYVLKANHHQIDFGRIVVN